MHDETQYSIDESIIGRLERAWQSGQQPNLVEFAPKTADANYLTTLEELVCVDMEYRFKRNSDPTDKLELVEFYLDRFTALATADCVRRLVHEEAGIRKRLGSISFADYQRRFPGVLSKEDFEALPESKAANSFDNAGPGDILGRYRLIEKIGEGGFGVVFLAEQTRPVQRRVALKVIKPGMGSSEVVARFKAELSALALMDHRHIARMLDAGATTTGSPYFVMEFVDGIPITEFCDQHKLTTRERLDLFIRVCNAIQHAHQKGIIHRDIKPSNILVSTRENLPTPKVIDFGIAKALEQPLTEDTLFTQMGQLIGTPQYMSPEQAEGSAHDVDTRSDVYCLGVLLYEMLTGSPPITADDFRRHAFDEVLRMIREHEYQKPSTRISHLGGAQAEVSANRQVDARRLSTQVRGDLDWIVMKALEKDRERRYPTAASFAEDIQRHIDNEPVVASPPSARYRLQKLISKHRSLVATAIAFAVLLLLGIATSSWYAVQASRESAAARKAETKAERQAKEADRSAKRATDVLKIVTDAFATANPESKTGGAPPATAHDVLLRALDSLDSSELDDAGRAVLFEALVRSFQGIGDVDASLTATHKNVETTQREFGNESPETWLAWNTLGLALHESGEQDQALMWFKRAYTEFHNKNGASNPETLAVLCNLARCQMDRGELSNAIELFDECYTRFAAIAPEDLTTMQVLGNRALAYQRAGKHEVARPMFEHVYRLRSKLLGPTHVHTYSAQNALGTAHEFQGEFETAAQYYRDSLDGLEQSAGKTHRETIAALNNLARAYTHLSRLDESIPLQQEALSRYQQVYGKKHRTVFLCQESLGMAYVKANQPDNAIAILEPSIPLVAETLGSHHDLTLANQTTLAFAYQTAGRLDDAIELAEKTYEARRNHFGESHHGTIVALNNLVTILRDARDLTRCETLAKRLVRTARNAHGELHHRTLNAMSAHATVLVELKRFEAAETLLSQTLRLRKSLHPKSWQMYDAMSVLGDVLLKLERNNESESYLRDGLEGLQSQRKSIPLLYRSQRIKAAESRLAKWKKAS